MSSLTSHWRPAILGLAVLTIACLACDGPRAIQSISGSTMGTSYDVTVELDRSVEDTDSLGRLVAAELAHLERVLSTYDPASDVSMFTAYEGTDPMPVDASLLEVLGAALEVSRLSEGAYDPTVGPLVDAWGFGPTDGPPPDSATVAALMAHVGYERLVADPASGTLAKTDPLVGLDLSGIAKGFAAERIARRLAELGYQSALVDVGGEVRALGSHVGGRPWRLAIEGPGAVVPEVLGTIDLRNEAVATSGDFRNFYEVDGELYTHILDPITGSPLPYRGFSVSVVHRDATRADAWATALTVLGPEDGLLIADVEDLAALFSWRSPEGVTTRASRVMRGRLTPVE